MTVADAIRQRLTAALAPARLELVDESARHAGHAGARPQGESHFRLTIVAAALATALTIGAIHGVGSTMPRPHRPELMSPVLVFTP